MTIDPLFVFGIFTALVGCGAMGITAGACREMSALSRTDGYAATSTLLGTLLFILLTNAGIVAGGLWVAFVVAGGAHG